VIGALAIGWAGGTPQAQAQAEVQRARQGLLSLEDARLFYEVVGTGEPIIVIHGGPGLDHRYLRPGLDALAARNTLVYYDQRGTGRSVANLDAGSINLDAFVEDIEALREALGYDQVSVLAHSFGALIGLEYAARFGPRLRALILMNPVEPGSRYGEQVAARRAQVMIEEDSTELAELRATEGFEARDAATLSQVYRVLFRQAFKDRTRIEELDMDLAASTAKNGQDVAALLAGGLGPIDWWDRLPEIDVPTLVLHGRFDIAPLEMSMVLAEALPVGTFEVLDSGHFPYLEDREGLLSAISGFFAGLGR
jgi:proline iminopeptidase